MQGQKLTKKNNLTSPINNMSQYSGDQDWLLQANKSTPSSSGRAFTSNNIDSTATLFQYCNHYVPKGEKKYTIVKFIDEEKYQHHHDGQAFQIFQQRHAEMVVQQQQRVLSLTSAAKGQFPWTESENDRHAPAPAAFSVSKTKAGVKLEVMMLMFLLEGSERRALTMSHNNHIAQRG